jgi:hypothetical protein
MRSLNTHRAIQGFISLTFAFISSGCASGNITLAPGADQVKITKVPTEVASCLAIGNVEGNNSSGLTSDGIRQMQNQAIGVGGNTVLVTNDMPPQKGIAYRCGADGNRAP